jgi:hypothetical protein
MAKVSRKWLEPIWATGAAGTLPTWSDLAWYALDENGAVGMFTSAGPGPIPAAVFRDLDTHLALVDYLDRLPVRGSHEVLIRYPRMSDYTRAANRGLFAFDYVYDYENPADGGYRLVARPTEPLPVDSLLGWARDRFEGIRLATTFASSESLILRPTSKLQWVSEHRTARPFPPHHS